MIDVSEEVPEDEVKALLQKQASTQTPRAGQKDQIHVNGDIFGLHKDPNRLVSQFKRRRRQGKIRSEVSLGTMP